MAQLITPTVSDPYVKLNVSRVSGAKIRLCLILSWVTRQSYTALSPFCNPVGGLMDRCSSLHLGRGRHRLALQSVLRLLLLYMLVYLRDGSAQTFLRADTLRQKLQINFSTSPSHSILIPGRPDPALILHCQASGRVATGVPILKSLV